MSNPVTAPNGRADPFIRGTSARRLHDPLSAWVPTRHLLGRVLREGPATGVSGIVAGAAGGVLLVRVAGNFVTDVQIPGAVAIVGAATVLVVAAIVASLTPAARASGVDVVRALRGE